MQETNFKDSASAFELPNHPPQTTKEHSGYNLSTVGVHWDCYAARAAKAGALRHRPSVSPRSPCS